MHEIYDKFFGKDKDCLMKIYIWIDCTQYKVNTKKSEMLLILHLFVCRLFIGNLYRKSRRLSVKRHCTDDSLACTHFLRNLFTGLITLLTVSVFISIIENASYKFQFQFQLPTLSKHCTFKRWISRVTINSTLFGGDGCGQ